MKKENPVETFKNFLNGNGHNITSARKKIAKKVFSTDSHFDVTTIWEKLREESNISLSTTYRTIELLLEAGLIREVDLGGSCSYYEHVLRRKQHGHMICINCNRVYEFPLEDLESTINEEAEKVNFRKKYFKLQVFGYCEDCMDQQSRG